MPGSENHKMGFAELHEPGRGRRYGLRTHLVALSLLLLTPALGLGVLAVWRASEASGSAFQEQLIETAHALSETVGQEIETSEAMLIGLATSPALDDLSDVGIAAFYGQARQVAAVRGSRIVLVGPGPEYRTRMTTDKPLGEPLPSGLVLPEEDAPLPRVFATGRRAVGGVGQRRGPGYMPVAVVVVPVIRGGRVIAALAMPLQPARFARVLQGRDLADRVTYASITDERGLVVARSVDNDRFIGRQAPGWFREAAGRQKTGFLRGVNLSGEDSVVAFSAVEAAPGWTVGLAEPRSAYAASWMKPLKTLGLGGVAIVGLGLVLAMCSARHLLRPVHELARYATALADPAGAVENGPGGVLPSATWISEFEVLRRGFVSADRALQARLAAAREAADAARRSEAALAESEARFARAVEAARIGTWEWDSRTDRLTGSRGFEALFGRAPGTMPTRAAFLTTIAAEDRPAVAQACSGASAVEDGALHVEFRAVWPSGEVRWLQLQGRAELGKDGRPLRISGAVVDVTERCEAQRAFQRLNASLAGQVREEIARREAAQARANQAERMQALGQLAGGIAHDFNNVLQSIQGAAALIERKPGDAASARRFSGMILASATRGAAVTRRLLAFARQGDIRAEVIATGALLHELQAVLDPVLGAAVAIEVIVAPTIPAVLADKGQLETVLVNLATNARDAMPRGGTLTLSAEVAEPGAEEAQALHVHQGSYVRIAVRDTGAGIDPSVQARIFEPFFTTKPIGEGTGLGLPMAKGFAEQSGGALTLVSEPGRGTVVTLWLPRAGQDGTSGPHEMDAVVQTGISGARGLKVLLVDDDDLVREALAAELEFGGYEVTHLSRGAEALAYLDRGGAADILVSDLSMPEMDGRTLLDVVHTRRPGMPAVLLTGYAADDTALALAGASGGRFSLLRKPVTGRHLLDRIADLLQPAAS